MYFITLFREALYINRSQRKPMHQRVLSPRRLFFRFPFVLDKKQNGHTAEFLIAASLAVKAGGKFEVDVHLKYQRKYIQLPDSHRRSRTNLCALLCTLLHSKNNPTIGHLFASTATTWTLTRAGNQSLLLLLSNAPQIMKDSLLNFVCGIIFAHEQQHFCKVVSGCNSVVVHFA